MKKLELGEKGGRILFKPQPNIEPLTVIKLIQSQPKTYALDGQDKLKIRMELPGAAERLGVAGAFVGADPPLAGWVDGAGLMFSSSDAPARVLVSPSSV